ncbi:MAG: prenyltransferase/squalene oxidase repeat-containing protein [Planctomycetaceae bacterium]
MKTVFLFVLMAMWSAHAALAGESLPREKLTDAVQRGVRLLEKAAKNYPEHRDCFACHHQTLPLLGMSEAKRIGIAIDQTVFDATLEFTRKHFADRTAAMREGRGIGGAALTVGYAAWTFEIAKHSPSDELRQAMAMFVVQRQERDGRWKPSAIRPPAEQSQVSNTVLALRVLQKTELLDEEWRVTAGAADRRGREWLDQQSCDLQEDLVFRLWGLQWLGGSATERAGIVERIVKRQREDGGWNAEGTLDSEAYSTGQTLFALLDNGVPADTPAVRRAAEYLVKSQHADGSWFVATRAKPVQVFFDNGDPHGNSQFISIAATGFSTAALARFVGNLRVTPGL